MKGKKLVVCGEIIFDKQRTYAPTQVFDSINDYQFQKIKMDTQFNDKGREQHTSTKLTTSSFPVGIKAPLCWYIVVTGIEIVGDFLTGPGSTGTAPTRIHTVPITCRGLCSSGCGSLNSRLSTT